MTIINNRITAITEYVKEHKYLTAWWVFVALTVLWSIFIDQQQSFDYDNFTPGDPDNCIGSGPMSSC